MATPLPLSYIAVLGQSNASNMRNNYSDGVASQEYLRQTFESEALFQEVSLSNYAVGATSVDADRMLNPLTTNKGWWFLDTGLPAPTLVKAIAGIRADIERLGLDTARDSFSVVWSQGESDASGIRQNKTDINRYTESTEAVFNYIRNEIGVDIQFFLVKTGNFSTLGGASESFVAGTNAALVQIREAQVALDERLDYVHIAADFTGRDMRDSWHYTEGAYDAVGKEVGGFIANTYAHLRDVANGDIILQADDVFRGEANIITGSEGADIFHYHSTSDSVLGRADCIVDFTVGQDMFDLTGLGYFGIVTSKAVEGQLRVIYNESSNRTYVKDDFSDFEFHLSGNYRDTLTKDSFILDQLIDTLRIGTDGADRIVSVDGNDTLEGGLGRDILTGGEGADIFRFALADSVKSSPDRITDFTVGVDKIDISSTSLTDLNISTTRSMAGGLRVTYNQTTNTTHLSSDQDSFGIALSGGDYRSTLTADSFIFGKPADLVVVGTDNADKLAAGLGNDTLDGGLGRDTLTGRAGADIFRFTDVTHSPRGSGDRIVDFVAGVDKLDVSVLDLNRETTPDIMASKELFLMYSATTNATFVRFVTHGLDIVLQNGDYRTTLTDSDFIF